MGADSAGAKPTRRPYRVIAASLFDEQADAADHITAALQKAGWPKANRSLVIREALSELADKLAGKSAEEIFRYFVDQYGRRVVQPAATRSARTRENG
jgi:hypothetical protein